MVDYKCSLNSNLINVNVNVNINVIVAQIRNRHNSPTCQVTVNCFLLAEKYSTQLCCSKHLHNCTNIYKCLVYLSVYFESVFAKGTLCVWDRVHVYSVHERANFPSHGCNSVTCVLYGAFHFVLQIVGKLTLK